MAACRTGLSINPFIHQSGQVEWRGFRCLPGVFIEEMFELFVVEIPGVAFVTNNARRIDQDTIRDAFYFQYAVHAALRVTGNGVVDMGNGHFANVRLGFVAYPDNRETIFEFDVKAIEFRDGLTAGTTPGRPEIDQYEFALH
jgi:hypothetical protein